MKGGKWREETRKSLDISPLFFHIIFKLVQAIFIAYDEIFQALGAEVDVLIPTDKSKIST
jgi:hypothetical protein